MTSTNRKTVYSFLLTAVLGLALTGPAHAASKTENLGVFGGAVAGAAAGGPVGLIVGAALGGHYAHQRQRASDALEQSAALAGDLEDLGAREARARASLVQLNERLDHLRVELATGQARIETLLDEQALLAQLQFNVLFRTDESALSDADKVQLIALSKVLNNNPALTVRLDGHADVRGSDAHNDALSMSRAQAVAEVLEGAQVDPEQIESRAFGERQAQAAAQDPEALARERRVRIELVRPQPATSKVAEVEPK